MPSTVSDSFKPFIGLIRRCDAHLTKLKGPIIRTGPNEVSFATVDSLETIYHGHNPRTGHFLKAHQEPFHVVLPGPSIFTAHEASDHRKMRKKIEPIFSARALARQEHLYRQHIDALCQQVEGKLREQNNIVNISDLISSAMFELVSDLAFGEPLEKGRSEAKALLFFNTRLTVIRTFREPPQQCGLYARRI